MGNFDDASLALIVALIEEFYMLFGSWPTVAQIKAELLKQR